MRLWHYKLVSKLPRQQLLGQHRECCALRGKGWGKRHSVVDYVFKHPYQELVSYHLDYVVAEMLRRGYHVDPKWLDRCYRGKVLGHVENDFTTHPKINSFYAEHTDKYYAECIDNLKQKGIKIA